jgi:hypothetical protein
MNRVQVQFVALLGAATLAAPARAQTGDHVACYKVKDRAKHGVFTLFPPSKPDGKSKTFPHRIRVPIRC